MTWTKDFVSKTFVISLEKRSDRHAHVEQELQSHGIDFEYFHAEENENGALGLAITMLKLCAMCLQNNYENVLIFEDDVKFLQSPHDVMNGVVNHIPKDYDIIYLGCNAYKPFKKFYSRNLLLIDGALALHACIWSKRGMEKFLSLQPELPIVPIDVSVANQIQPDGKCYAVYPILCTQYDSYSDIEKKEVKYAKFIENRFVKAVEGLTK